MATAWSLEQLGQLLGICGGIDPAPSVVSAPGKVLVAGGYLILERPHTGLVLALDARFHTAVQLSPSPPDVQAEGLVVETFSPQFRDRRRYLFTGGGVLPSDAPAALTPLPGADGKVPRENRYVEVPLLYSLSLLRALLGPSFVDFAATAARAKGWAHAGRVGLQVILAADNGFYSQTAELQARGWELSVESLEKLPPMLPPRPDASGEIAKTGLGSSATLVTSLVGALLHRFGLVALPGGGAGGAEGGAALDAAGRTQLELLHSLAQLAHCAAQGKVGSGFDVCAAVYGSHRYMRFSPAALKEGLALPAGAAPADVLVRCVGRGAAGDAAPWIAHLACPDAARWAAAKAEAAPSGPPVGWDHGVTAVELPAGIEVMMADVACGANTPSMVKKVNAWREAEPSARALWGKYAKASASLQVRRRPRTRPARSRARDRRAAQARPPCTPHPTPPTPHPLSPCAPEARARP